MDRLGTGRQNGNESLLVTITEESLAKLSLPSHSQDSSSLRSKLTKSNTICTCQDLSDPATGSNRTYLIYSKSKTDGNTQKGNSKTDSDLSSSSCNDDIHNNTPPLLQIAELTAIHGVDEEHASFFVGNSRVISDGRLYTITPVDALFWILAMPSNAPITTTTTTTPLTKQSWQPLDQILQGIDETITKALDYEQLEHLYNTMSLGENEVYWKFSPEKALDWMSKKQKHVQQALFLQLQRRAKEQTSMQIGMNNGAISSNLVLPSINDDTIALQKSLPQSNDNTSGVVNARDLKLQQQAREESFQLVCTYLSPAWIDSWLDYANVKADDVLLSEATRKRKSNSTTTTPIANSTPLPSTPLTLSEINSSADKKHKAAKVDTPMSAGAKRLAKVNTTGMKKMSAFFAAAPSKK